MKHFFAISLLLLFASCNNAEKPKTSKRIPSIKAQKDTIVQLFEEWKKEQVKNGSYLADKYCDQEWMLKQYDRPDFESLNIPTMGFPSEKGSYGYSFGDVNQDGRLDGMVSFDPVQCDGGNGLMWYSTHVLIISENEKYKISDTVDFSNFGNTAFDSNGIYQIGKISGQKVSGTYIEFLPDDLPGYPSIFREVIFDFSSRKLIHLGDYFKLSKEHKPNIIYCDMDGDKRKDTVKLVQNTANEKYGLAIEFGNGRSEYLGMGADVLEQGLFDLERVGIFKKAPKGQVVWENIFEGEIITAEEVAEENKIKLPNDGIYIHSLESCGGGIIYWKDGKLFWVQQE